MSTTATARKTAEERRVEILEAARAEFADRGFEGASTDTIARRAGISQPYLFRLFGTKKGLFIASVEGCFAETLAMFREAAEGKRGEEALAAIGEAYVRTISEDSQRLRGQMQAYVACQDEEVCAVVRRGFGELVQFVEGIPDVPQERIVGFFAQGMLLNVIASMSLLDAREAWAQRLLAACRGEAA